MLIEETIPKRGHRNFHILPMTEHDLLEVVEVEEECGLSPWGWEAYYSELSKNSIMFVAHSNDWKSDRAIFGFIAASLVADELHINNVGVRPSHRNKGLGSALLKAAIREGVRRGAMAAFLEVRISNLAAQALYKKHGFAVVGQREDYYGSPIEDAVIMRSEFS